MAAAAGPASRPGQIDECTTAVEPADAAIVQAELLAESIVGAARFEAARIVGTARRSTGRHDGLITRAESLSGEAISTLPALVRQGESAAAEVLAAADQQVRAIRAEAQREAARIKQSAEEQALSILRRTERRVDRLERRHRLFRRQLRAPFTRRRAAAGTTVALVVAAAAAVVVLSPDLSHPDTTAVALPAAVASSEAAVAPGCPIPSLYRSTFVHAAARSHVPLALLGAVAEAESAFNPAARSGAGAQGMLQLMPATARMLAVNPLSVRQNIRGGARYLRYLRTRFGSYESALAAYHAGPTAQSHLSYGPATRRYVDGIMSRRAAFETCAPTAHN